MGVLFSREFSCSSNSSIHCNNNNKKNKAELVPQEKKLNSRIIWGREYHGIESSVYMLPKDNREIDRLHDQHFIAKELLGFNIMEEAFELLDFEKGKLRVLDICCGPATWLCEESLEHPNCHFAGIDMCNLWPQDIRPMNLHFAEANVLDGLPYADQSFDFIQIRFSELSFKTNEWSFILSEIKRVLKSGGCFQWVGVEMRVHMTKKDTAVKHLNDAFTSFCTMYQLEPSIGSNFHQLISQSQMEILQTEYRQIPLGWGGPIGNAYLHTFSDVLIGLAPWLKGFFNIDSQENYQSFIQNTQNAFVRSKSYIGLHAFLAKKQ
ncbi:hypothetical protein BY458DRAFT_452254 [Sporodiniella umbellata]|nr:hypothetical protein BY458DRAFT_452254 [Sporodiniella umbellata]